MQINAPWVAIGLLALRTAFRQFPVGQQSSSVCPWSIRGLSVVGPWSVGSWTGRGRCGTGDRPTMD